MAVSSLVFSDGFVLLMKERALCLFTMGTEKVKKLYGKLLKSPGLRKSKEGWLFSHSDLNTLLRRYNPLGRRGHSGSLGAGLAGRFHIVMSFSSEFIIGTGNWYMFFNCSNLRQWLLAQFLSQGKAKRKNSISIPSVCTWTPTFPRMAVSHIEELPPSPCVRVLQPSYHAQSSHWKAFHGSTSNFSFCLRGRLALSTQWTAYRFSQVLPLAGTWCPP